MNIIPSPQDTNNSSPAPINARKPVTADFIIDLTLIAQLRKDIAKIGTQSTEGISKRQAVILLLPEITDARTRKVSFKGIEAAFKARGILISAATIGTYWRQAIADSEGTKPKSRAPIPKAILSPEVDIASHENTQVEVEASKSTIISHSIADDEDDMDDETILRLMRGESPNTELVERE